MGKLEFKYASVEALTKPGKSGLHDVYVDYWWYQVPGKGIAFARDRSSGRGVNVLANSDRKITDMLAKRYAPEGAEVLQLPLAFVPTDYEGEQRLPREPSNGQA